MCCASVAPLGPTGRRRNDLLLLDFEARDTHMVASKAICRVTHPRYDPLLLVLVAQYCARSKAQVRIILDINIIALMLVHFIPGQTFGLAGIGRNERKNPPPARPGH